MPDLVHALTYYATLYPTVLASDLTRYAVGAGGVFLVVNLAFATALVRRKIRPETPPARQFVREIAASLRTVAIFAAFGTLIGLGHHVGLIPLYFAIDDYGWLWFAASTLILIVAHDAWFYWSHRIIHRPRLFRRFHRLHHRSVNPTPFTSYAFDASEAVVNAAFLPLILLVLPAHPIALLAFTGHMMLRNAIGHCGYELFPARRDGRPLLGWLTTVTHHDLHHAEGRWNFGLYFTWWDRWMGTEHPAYADRFAASVGRAGRLAASALIALVAALSHTRPAEAAPADIAGLWAADRLAAVVQIEPCAGDPALRCGRVVWVWAAEVWPKASVGSALLADLRPEGDEWTGGVMIHPETGLTFRGDAHLLSENELRLEGCAAFLCDAVVWRSLGSLRASFSGLSPDDRPASARP